MPSFSARSFSFGFHAPACDSPERSPFTSAMNTGTPMRLNCSAMRCSVTVLPVPVAPVIRPWRLASPGSRKISRSDFAISIGSGMAGSGGAVINF